MMGRRGITWEERLAGFIALAEGNPQEERPLFIEDMGNTPFGVTP